MAYTLKQVADLRPEQIAQASPRHIQSVIEELQATVDVHAGLLDALAELVGDVGDLRGHTGLMDICVTGEAVVKARAAIAKVTGVRA